MSPRPALTGLVLTLTAFSAPAQTPKRPLRHSDYGGWNSATGMTLSPDGKYLAYTLAPAEGDGAVVVRNVSSGSEHRVPTGRRAGETGDAATPAANPEPTAEREEEEEPDQAPPTAPPPSTGPVGGPVFTPDSKRVLFAVQPTKAETDKAKADKAAAPKAVVVVAELEPWKVVERIERVRTFSVVGDGAGVLVYRKEPKATEPPKADAPAEAPTPRSRFGSRPTTPGTPGTPPTPQPESPTELVVRDLAGGAEWTLLDVTEYSVSKDAKLLTYAVRSKSAGSNGVYQTALRGSDPPATLVAGPGRYTRLTWNEPQTRLAFFRSEPLPEPPTTPPGGTSPPPPPPTETTGARVFVWERSTGVDVAGLNASQAVASAVAAVGNTSPAVEVLGPATAGLKPGWGVVERGGLSFSADGKKLYAGTALLPKPSAAPKTTSTTPPPSLSSFGGRGTRSSAGATSEDKVDLDLWSWKDDAIQPMQKVRANVQRARSYRGVYFLDTREFRHLSDEDTEVNVPGHGDWGLAISDKAYRRQLWLSPSPRDYAAVNVRTGESKPTFPKQASSVFRSPKGRFLAAFDGQHWQLVAVPDGKKINLTAKVPAKFGDEDFDAPTTRPAHGLSGWTPDEKYVLLNDRYDIWKVATDGSGAENLTRVGRKTMTRLRHQRLGEPAPDAEFGIDLSKPLFLTAENIDTRDTGFYRLDPGRDPVMLVMGAKKYGTPVKAKHGDTLLFTVSSFYDFPDYFTADPEFKEVKRVTDLNPQKAGLNWGRAELVRYHSADGVPLSGMLVKPEDFDPTKKYPMIVYIYERLSQNLHGFRPPAAGTSINPTYYASNGYLVLMPDIAYTVGSPGQSALKCVLPAIQAVADKGCVNEKAIGIQGHSWGGLPDGVPDYPDGPVQGGRGRCPGGGHGQRLRRHPMGDRATAAVPVRTHPEPDRGDALAGPDEVRRELADLHGRPGLDPAADAAQRQRRRRAVVPGDRILLGLAASRQGGVFAELCRRAARFTEAVESEGLHDADATVLRPPLERGTGPGVDDGRGAVPGPGRREGAVEAAVPTPGEAVTI